MIFCYLFFLLFLSPTISAQNFDSKLHEAYLDVLSLKLNKARAIKNLTFDHNIDKAFQVYILSLSDVLELLLVKNQVQYDKYRSHQRDYHNAIKDISDEDDFIDFVGTEIQVHTSLARIRYGDQISGAFKLIRSYNTIKKFDSAYYDSNPYFLKTAGLLNIMLDLFPDQYNWILSMFQVKPDISEGFKQLEKLSKLNSVFRLESMMLYAISESFFGNNKSAGYNIFKNQYENNFNNLLYNYLYGISSIKTQNNDQAIICFDSCIKFEGNFLNIPLINYYRAESYLKKREYNKASLLYSFYLDRPNGNEFIKDTYYKLFHINLLLGDSSTALRDLENIKSKGGLDTGADKYAYNRISNNYSPNLLLFESRLLFDGGYYDQSLKILESFKMSKPYNQEDQAEYFYRKARNLQKTGKYEAAIESYQIVADNESISQYYFWANSWIQLGNIYRIRGNAEYASDCYKRAASYKGKEYRNSITTEAKAALKELN